MSIKLDREHPWMDGYLKSNLLTLRNSAYHGNFDNFLITSGLVGTGKSTIASHCCDFFNHEDTITRGEEIFYFDMEKLSKDLQSYPKNSVFVIDEAGDTFMSSDSRRFLNNNLYKLLLKVRAKKHMIVLVIPDFFDLRAGLATRRAFALINCQVVPDDKENKFKNGLFDFYNLDKMSALYWKGKREHNYKAVHANFYAGFDHWFPCDYDSYEKKKFKSLLLHEEKKEVTHTQNKYLKQRDFAIGKAKGYGCPNKELLDGLGMSDRNLRNIPLIPRKT